MIISTRGKEKQNRKAKDSRISKGKMGWEGSGESVLKEAKVPIICAAQISLQVLSYEEGQIGHV